MTLSSTALVNGWDKIQEKTFTRWVNSKLLVAIGKEPISNLCADLGDGVYLTHLVSFLSPYSIDPIYKKPKHRLQKMENLNAVFDFMKFNEIHLYNIGSEDILEGNYKLTMGLLWTLILHFSSMRQDSDSQSSMKEKLLKWCQDVTNGHQHVRVVDFTTSWNNGMALCAMIDHFHPELIKYSKLQPSNKLQNATLALEIATRRLKIPELIDVEDLICDHPDEKSITAYIIEWHHKFGDLDMKEAGSDTNISRIDMESEPLAQDLDEAIDETTGAELNEQLIQQNNKNLTETKTKENDEETKAVPNGKVESKTSEKLLNQESKQESYDNINKEDTEEVTKSSTNDIKTRDDAIKNVKAKDVKANELSSDIVSKDTVAKEVSKNSDKKDIKKTQDNQMDEQLLLSWCNKITKKHNLTQLTDFSTCFLDGLALCAIVDEMVPESIAVATLEPEKGQENLDLALKLSKEKLGIGKSIKNFKLKKLVTNDDDDNLISLLKELRSVSYQQQTQKLSFDDVERFVEAADHTIKLQNEYEERSAHLIDSMDEHLTAWGTLSHINRCTTYDDIVNERNDLKIYTITMKRKWLKEKADLNLLLGKIKTKQLSYNLPPYNPPPDLSPNFINCLWLSLTDIEREAFRRVNLIAKKIQDELCQNCATTAELIKDVITTCEEEFSLHNVELDIQLEVLMKQLDDLKPLDAQLIHLQNLEIKCREAEILNNEYTICNYDDLQFELILLRELILEQVEFLESENDVRNAKLSRRMTTEQKDEFEEMFKKVDMEGKQYLTLKEFKNTLRVLNVDFEVEEVIELYEFGKERNLKGMNLDGFLKVMTELIGKEEFSANELISSFRQISGGKPFLTDDDLLKAKLNKDMISKIRRTFPKYIAKSVKDDGSSIDEEEDLANISYDFIQFVSKVAGMPLAT